MSVAELNARRGADIAPGDLGLAINDARARALASGALIPVTVEAQTVEEAGVAFRVEWMSSLAMKDLAAKIPRAGDKPKATNPFLPYEEDLFVADLSGDYVAILNKFPAFPGHILMITRGFAEQQALLGPADFHACAVAMAGLAGLMFFNAGAEAGASQRHRHFQIIGGLDAPIASNLPTDAPVGACVSAPALPFRHAFARLDASLFDRPDEAADMLARVVGDCLDQLGLTAHDGALAPYNISATRDWALVVPRTREAPEGLSLSALSYSGVIGLRQPELIDEVRRVGPMRLLIEGAQAR